MIRTYGGSEGDVLYLGSNSEVQIVWGIFGGGLSIYCRARRAEPPIRYSPFGLRG